MPCKGMWDSINIDVNGNITTCCLDIGMKNKIGNLKDMDLYEAWTSDKIEKWRKAQMEGRFDESGPFCLQCNFLTAEQLPKKVFEEFRKKGWKF